jgi:putative NAD(P)-binding protein
VRDGGLGRDANRVLIQAAATAGVEHLVLVSVLGAAPDHPMSLHRAKHAAEQALQANGLAWTIVRPAAFLETWSAVIGAKLASNGQALVFGQGRNPVNFVSAHDVAAVVDLAIRDPSLRGQLLQAMAARNVGACTTHLPGVCPPSSGRGRDEHHRHDPGRVHHSRPVAHHPGDHPGRRPQASTLGGAGHPRWRSKPRPADGVILLEGTGQRYRLNASTPLGSGRFIFATHRPTSAMRAIRARRLTLYVVVPMTHP